MASVNKVILVGNLGADPETRVLDSGNQVTTFRMATTDTWKDKQTGEKRERTEWHRIQAWGRLAEICAQYLTKGRQVYVEGRLQTREWEDNSGVKRWTTEIVANVMQMLGQKDQSSQPRREATQGELQTYGPPPAEVQKAAAALGADVQKIESDNDLPF